MDPKFITGEDIQVLSQYKRLQAQCKEDEEVILLDRVPAIVKKRRSLFFHVFKRNK